MRGSHIRTIKDIQGERSFGKSRRPWLLCWLILGVGVFLFGRAGFAQTPAQDPLAGSRVFGAKACAQCHAINGVGGKIGPDLGRLTDGRSFYDLAAAMWNHLPAMAARMRELSITSPELSPRETGDLIAFLSTVNYFELNGDAKAGKKLFLEKRCVVCHQVGGVGGVVGPDLNFIGQSGSSIFLATAMWNHGFAMAEAMRARGVQRPTFQRTELRDLIAFLKSVGQEAGKESLHILPGKAGEGKRLFTEKRCIECHSVKGNGGKVGPDLADRRLERNLLDFAAAMWNKAPAMMKAMAKRNITLPELRPDEMADIVAYLYSVQYFTKPGDPQLGERLLSAKGCLKCHSVGGKGERIAPDFALLSGLDQAVSIVSAMWNHATTMEQKARETGVSWPALKGEEMAHIVSFLQSLDRSR